MNFNYSFVDSGIFMNSLINSEELSLLNFDEMRIGMNSLINFIRLLMNCNDFYIIHHHFIKTVIKISNVSHKQV